MIKHACTAAIALVVSTGSATTELKPTAKLILEGKPSGSKSLSAVAMVRAPDLFVMASDEGTALDFFRLDVAQARFVYLRSLKLAGTDATELDLEGLTIHKGSLVATGSHSLSRMPLRSDVPAEERRKSILETTRHSLRAKVFRLKWDDKIALEGFIPVIEQSSLDGFLKTDELLARFYSIPAKENGIDIEAISSNRRNNLLFGLRGPVVAGHLAVVLEIKPEDLFGEKKGDALRHFLNLGAYGIRDMTAVEGGQLILAGPVNALASPHKIFFWTEKGDSIDGENTVELGQLAWDPESFQAEGMTLIEETPLVYRLLIVSDSVKGGAPRLYEVSK